jgi:excinuclease ABC subunit A
MSFSELGNRLPQLLKGFIPEHLKNTAESLVQKIAAVEKLGIGYLTTGRGGDTLSGGELQRLRLSPLATGHLNGMLICLDEPASGLYETDVDKLWQVLSEIRDHGNTLVLIEHHPAIIARADWIIEMGPGPGELGGKILFQGPGNQVLGNPDSPTAKWIASLAEIRHKMQSTKIFTDQAYLNVKNFAAFDMEPVNAHFPVGHFSVVTGESGSGKSTLLFKHILPHFEKGDYSNLGFEAISLLSTGSFIGNRKSSVASAIQIMTPLRELFASLPESKVRGYHATRFGTHVPGGRCETCKGEGVLHDPSGYEESLCPVCLGRKFRDEILDIRFKTLSIADVLDLSIEKALSVFSFSHNFTEKLAPLQLTGLGYLHLGQPTTHLSGGERARLRLAIALSKAKAPRTLYLFDEPARGLHQEDIRRMIELIQKLCAEGHTVIAIEHQQDFCNAADYMLTLSRKTKR